jgi:hypothetical protein
VSETGPAVTRGAAARTQRAALLSSACVAVGGRKYR